MEKTLSVYGVFGDLIKVHTNIIQIWGFRYNYEFLSHMYPCKVQAHGIEYPSVENAYQSMMTLDLEWREKIRKVTPQEAKKLSRQMPIREDKDKIKLKVMYILDKRKFENNSILLEKLKNTGNKVLIEGNIWHDNFWGDCQCEKCKNIPGLNNAGKILMRVRDENQN